MSTDTKVFSPHSSKPHELRRKASFSAFVSTELDGFARAQPGDHDGDCVKTKSKAVEKMTELMSSYMGNDKESLQRSIVNHLEYTLACSRFRVDQTNLYRATAFATRDRLIEVFKDTNMYFAEKNVKRCYYFSLEFLIGRYFQNALCNMDIEENYRSALAELGVKLEDLYSEEHDPALGNGGLGRLAACFLDSMATRNLPCWGYGIRYTYGIFEQRILNGRQIENPDFWLTQANPWEIPRSDVTYAVRFYGHVENYDDSTGKRKRWTGGELVQAMAYDNPMPGHDTYNCINLRLWKACPGTEFDFNKFNQGEYIGSIEERQRAESISSVLYPNDNTQAGKELRLRQQYFFVSASVQDLLRRFTKHYKGDVCWDDLPDKVALQLNDTHPAICIPELMRILIDIMDLDWNYAWSLVKKCVNYTNHTVLPEALEKWSENLIREMLPRHFEIICKINQEFLDEVRSKWSDGPEVWDMSIFEEGGNEKRIKMANLAVIGSNKVNGVAAIHTEILKKTLFKNFKKWFDENGFPDKFLNMTNGVTPRRWIYCCNRPLADLISKTLNMPSASWLNHLSLIEGLIHKKDDVAFQTEWRQVKSIAKLKLTQWVNDKLGIDIDPTALFDIQVKRIHEYKRQLLFALFMIHRYLQLKDASPQDRNAFVKRVCFVGGKAAPGYATAKTIIKFINNISKVVCEDADINKFLKVVFLPNYNVTNAQTIIPASDLSEHISTAGTEASGTSNMKFVMNGGLIMGTMDGANVEIREEAGEDSMFIFGALEHEVADLRKRARDGNCPVDHRLRRVIEVVKSGMFSLGDHHAQQEFNELMDRLLTNGDGHNGDFYLHVPDFPSYIAAQEDVDRTWQDAKKWTALSIQASAMSGKFSTDRTMDEYAKYIWDLPAAERPAPGTLLKKRSFGNAPSTAVKGSNGYNAKNKGGAVPPTLNAK